MTNEKRQSYLQTAAGIDVAPAGVPYWKPDGRVRRITVTAARPPTAEEAVPRAIKDKDGNPTGDTVKVLAFFDIEAEGVPHRWDVSSRRALSALDAAITTLPMDLLVQTKGSGMATTYVIAAAPPDAPKKAKADKPEFAAGSLGEPCDAPACTLRLGHPGRHLAAPPAAQE